VDLTRGLPRDTLAVAGAFVVSGVVHLVRPETFEPLVPRALPAHREIILASGAAELACAAGLLHPRTRRAAGLASAALLVGVLPGNVQMAVDAQRGGSTAYKAGTLARLPLQLPMIRAVLRVART
jgi:uncharacterized membrane protein